MTKENQDFELHNGEIKIPQFTVDKPDGSTKDLTGYKARWIAIDPKDDEIVIDLHTDTDNDITIPNPAGGIVEVRVDLTGSSELYNSYRHELYVIDTSGEPSVVATGEMFVK